MFKLPFDWRKFCPCFAHWENSPTRTIPVRPSIFTDSVVHPGINSEVFSDKSFFRKNSWRNGKKEWHSIITSWAQFLSPSKHVGWSFVLLWGKHERSCEKIKRTYKCNQRNPRKTNSPLTNAVMAAWSSVRASNMFPCLADGVQLPGTSTDNLFYRKAMWMREHSLSNSRRRTPLRSFLQSPHRAGEASFFW